MQIVCVPTVYMFKCHLFLSQERTGHLRKWHELVVARQNEMAKVMTMENGKPLKESIGEITYGADYIEWFAEETRRIHVCMYYALSLLSLRAN